MASSVPMTRRTGALKTEMSPAEPSRPQTSNSGKTTTDDKSSVRKSIEARRKERRAAVDSAREAFYGQDNKSSTSFVYVSPADAESRSSSRTVTAPPQPDKTTQLLLSLPSIPPRKTSTPLRYQRQSHRRTASSEIDAFPLPPTHTNHPQTSPTSPAIGFSYNKTPMSPPTPPRPPGGRAAQVLTLKEKLNRALTRRRDKLDLTKPPPAFDAQRPGSNGESLPLTYTSTHSRSQSGVSTPPTQCSNPSPTMPTEGYGQFPQSKSGNESDWVTDWGTHESLYYEDDDEGYLPAIRPNSARAVRPMDTIEEEEQARLNRRTAFANLHNPMRQNAPTSSSFETGLVLSSSMELYGESIDDRQALASFDFGLDRSDSRNVHLDENGRPDSFGSNYIPSDSEDGYEDCSPSPSRNDIYDSMVSMDDEEDITRQVGIQSSYLTDESLAAKAVDEEERGRLAKEFPTVQAYLRAQASSPPPVPQIKDRGTFLDPKTPEDRRGQSYLDAKTPDETNNNALSFLDVITASSESDIPPIGLAIGDNTNRTAGPHAQTSGVVPAANASSTVLGNQSLRSGNSSSDQSRLSSFRTQTGSSSQGTGIMRRGTSSSARGSHRPGVSRNSSSYMNVDIRTPEEEQNVHRNLEDQIRRLSKISASSSSGDTRSGFAVVVVAHGDGPHSGPSIRGSIEIISGGSKSVTPRTPASRMLSGDEAGEQNDGKDGDDQSTTSDHSYNDKHVSISSEDELIQPPRKLLPAQKLQPGVKVHPADARYDHVYRMRETFPNASQIMVPVYNYSPTSAFPHRNALTAPLPAKIIDRYSASSQGVFELGTIRSNQSAAGPSFEMDNINYNNPALKSPQPAALPNPQLKLASPHAFERASALYASEARQPLSRREPTLPSIDSATLRRMQPASPTPRTKSAMSGSSHIELPKSPTIQSLHPALRTQLQPARFSTPKLRMPKTSHRYDEEVGAYLPLDAEVKLEQRKISRMLFILACLFPPLLLVLAYGGLDAVVYELSNGRAPVADSRVKSAAKWVGWGVAVTIVAGVGGGVVGAVVVARGV